MVGAADADRRSGSCGGCAATSSAACSARELAARLVLLFALVAVLPGALVYAVSVQFLGRSIESWFDVRVDRALEGGLALGRDALDYLLQGDDQQGAQIGDAGRRRGRRRYPIALSRAAEQAGVVRGRAVHRDRRRARGRRASAQSTVSPEPPPRAGAAPRAPAAAVRGGRRSAATRCWLRVVVPVNSARPATIR